MVRMVAAVLPRSFAAFPKQRELFFKLILGSNSVTVCSKTCLLTYYLPFRPERGHSFPSPLCCKTHFLRSLRLNLNLIEVTPNQQYVYDTIHKHDISVHLNSSWKSPGSHLSCYLCLAQHVREKKFPSQSAVQLSLQPLNHNSSHSLLISGRKRYSSSFSARARWKEFVSISKFSNMFRSQNLVKNPKVSTFGVLHMAEGKTRQGLVFGVQSVLWRVQRHIMHCLRDLASWTVNYQ